MDMTDRDTDFMILGIFVGVIVGIVLGAIVLSVVIEKLSPNEYTQKALDQYLKSIEAITECEKELHRNQSCEVVISAKLKDGKL